MDEDFAITLPKRRFSRLMKAMRICHRVVHRFVITTIALQAGYLCVAAQEARFVIPPQSVNISLNKVAEINCKAIATFINWRVNGLSLDNIIRSKGFDDSAPTVTIDVTQNLRMRTLRVMGSPDSNGTNITCLTILQVTTTIFVGNSSEPALILVQGLLGPVHNLTVTTINSITVLISWSPPFTLEGVPILGYNVTITNTTNGENETVSVEDTTLLYSIDHPDPENNFTVTVVPLNEVGAGEWTTSEPFLFPFPVDISKTVLGTISLLTDPESSHATTSDGTVTPTLLPSMTTVSVTVVVLAVVTSCVVITSLGLLATACFFVRKHKIKCPGTPAQDVVMVSDNPAYQQIQRIEMKENTVYHTVHHPAVSPQYEHIPQYVNTSQFGVVREHEVGSWKRESPDYEDVSVL